MAVYRIKHFDVKSGESYSNGEFTNWDGTKKNSGWGI